MSTLAEHLAEQASLTAACEAGACDHPGCRDAEPANRIHITERQRDAIWAGLRLLQCSLEQRPGHHPVAPDDGDIGDILTNAGKHAGLTADEIDAFIDDVLAFA